MTSFEIRNFFGSIEEILNGEELPNVDFQTFKLWAIEYQCTVYGEPKNRYAEPNSWDKNYLLRMHVENIKKYKTEDTKLLKKNTTFETSNKKLLELDPSPGFL